RSPPVMAAIARRRPRAAIRLESRAAHPHRGCSRPYRRIPATSMPSSPIGTPWVVRKVGGTSVSQRHRWDTMGRMACKRADACGGRALAWLSARSGVTSELAAVAGGADDGAARVEALVARHRDYVRELGLDADAVLGERLKALAALVAGDPRAP